jgi:hypothetical protein
LQCAGLTPGRPGEGTAGRWVPNRARGGNAARCSECQHRASARKRVKSRGRSDVRRTANRIGESGVSVCGEVERRQRAEARPDCESAPPRMSDRNRCERVRHVVTDPSRLRASRFSQDREPRGIVAELAEPLRHLRGDGRVHRHLGPRLLG